MSAETIQFIPRLGRDNAQTDFPTIVFHAAAQEPTIGPVDVAPDKQAGPTKRES